MNRALIDVLLADVSADVDPRRRRRVDGYAAAARRCEDRICTLRAVLEEALRVLDHMTALDADRDAAADEVLRFVSELDALERVQPRLDAWLDIAISAVTDDSGLEAFGENPPRDRESVSRFAASPSERAHDFTATGRSGPRGSGRFPGRPGARR